MVFGSVCITLAFAAGLERSGKPVRQHALVRDTASYSSMMIKPDTNIRNAIIAPSIFVGLLSIKSSRKKYLFKEATAMGIAPISRNNRLPNKNNHNHIDVRYVE